MTDSIERKFLLTVSVKLYLMFLTIDCFWCSGINTSRHVMKCEILNSGDIAWKRSTVTHIVLKIWSWCESQIAGAMWGSWCLTDIASNAPLWSESLCSSSENIPQMQSVHLPFSPPPPPPQFQILRTFKISISPVCRVIWVFRGGGVGLVFPHYITRKICFKASVLHNTQCALYIAQYIYRTQNILYTHMCPWKSTLHRKHLGCSLTKKREHVENTILYYLYTLHSIAWHCIGGGWVGLEVAEQTALDNEAKYLARRRLPGFLDQIHILPTHHTSKHIRLHPPTPFSPKLRPLAYKYVCKKLTFFIFCVFPLFTRGWGGT